MTALFTYNLPLLAGAPNGIKKLRGLILELAVRGKLVPQDPNDEPARELLKRIAEEKTRLVADGKIKTLKLIEELPNLEGLSSLPSSWRWVRFGEIAQHNSGKTLDKGRNTGIYRDYITTSNLYWGRFELDNVKQMLIREDELDKCTATKNDLLICEGGEAGRAAVWEQNKEICFQNHVHRARLYGNVSPHYAQRFFEKINASGEISQYRKGIGISNMSSKALASITFPLPPLAEQHRIVAKVDELMTLCDRLEVQQADAENAHAQLVQALLDSLTQACDANDFATNWQRLAEHFHTLFITERSIDALKQTLLQLAVMGKLVPQAPSDEPANELLRRINEERSRLVAAGQLKKQKQLGGVTDNEQCFPPPNGWAWTRFGATVKSLNNGLYKPAGFYTDSGVISLRMYNIQDGAIVFSDIRRVNIDDDEIDQYRLQAGDLLINRVNSKDLVGKTAVIPGIDEPLVYESMNMRARPFVGFVDSLYLNLFMRTRLAKDTLLSHAKEAIGQASLNQGQISSLAIPLPPLAEQHRIVAKVDQLMALCEQLKTRICQAQQLNERLASTLVKQAVA